MVPLIQQDNILWTYAMKNKKNILRILHSCDRAS